MNRKAKALGLALMAVLAMGAIAAQGASAHTFTLETAPAALTGKLTSNIVWTMGSTNKTCTSATMNGSQASTSATTMTLTPHFTGCTLGGSAATVDNNGCQFVFGSTTPVANKAPMSIECGHSGSITTTGPACTVHVSDTHTGGGHPTVNQNLSGVSYTNTGAGSTRELTLTLAVTGITYEGTGFGCAILGISGTKHDGAMAGSVTITGDHLIEAPHIGVFFS